MNDLSSSDQDVIQLSLEKGLVPLSMYRNDFDFFPRALALMQTYVYEDHLENSQPLRIRNYRKWHPFCASPTGLTR